MFSCASNFTLLRFNVVIMDQNIGNNNLTLKNATAIWNQVVCITSYDICTCVKFQTHGNSGKVFLQALSRYGWKYLDSVKCNISFNFINTPQYGSGLSVFLTLKMWSFKEEELLMSITYHSGVTGWCLG